MGGKKGRRDRQAEEKEKSVCVEEEAKLNERNCLEFIITFSMHVYF